MLNYLYHASPIPNIKTLNPNVSNHGESWIYLSSKKENVLVYLSNAVEKHCKETGFTYNGVWKKWATYGFTKEGKLHFEEYYPNALYDTYGGVSGYIYSVETNDNIKKLPDIQNAYYSDSPIVVCGCEFINDAYNAIIFAEEKGLIVITRYEELSKEKIKWIDNIIKQEYDSNENHPEYRFFLKNKFNHLDL